MGYGIILYVYIISLLTKNVPTIIYFPAIFSIKILSQMLIVSLVFYFKTNKYICVFILFVIKFYKKITIFVKYIQINKFLLYNKLAIIHISFYLVTLIYLFHYQINTHKYKFNITYFILITFILGIL